MDINSGTELLKLVGIKIEKYRKIKKLSYRQLGQLCDIDYSDISKIEKGRVNVQLLTIFELANGLEIHPKQLLDFDFEFDK